MRRLKLLEGKGRKLNGGWGETSDKFPNKEKTKCNTRKKERRNYFRCKENISKQMQKVFLKAEKIAKKKKKEKKTKQKKQTELTFFTK